jgi:hypothetical protein
VKQFIFVDTYLKEINLLSDMCLSATSRHACIDMNTRSIKLMSPFTGVSLVRSCCVQSSSASPTMGSQDIQVGCRVGLCETLAAVFCL